MNVLSFQSHVTYGHVGNSAAAFALQRLGINVWPVHTVLYSNHPGHGAFRGAAATPAALAEIVAGLDAQGLLAECDAVLSGYLGDPGTSAVVADAVERVKAQNPDAVFCLDPVMGDEDGLYVDEALPDAIAEQLLPLADIVTPNGFELAQLTGIAPTGLHDALAGMQALWRAGPRLVVATSLAREDGPPEAVEAIALAGDGAWSVAVPALPFGMRPGGAGDLFAALFLAHCLQGSEAPVALSLAASATWGVLRRTLDGDARELLLIEAQDELAAPEELFEASPVA